MRRLEMLPRSSVFIPTPDAKQFGVFHYMTVAMTAAVKAAIVVAHENIEIFDPAPVKTGPV